MALETLSWPSAPTLTDANDSGQAYFMGVAFSVPSTQSCSGVQWRVPDSVSTPPGGTHAVAIFDDSTGTRLAYEEFVPVAGGNQNVTFTAGAISLVNTKNYVACVYTVHYVFRSGSPSGISTPSSLATAIEGRLDAYSGGSSSAVKPTGVFSAIYYVSPIVGTGGTPFSKDVVERYRVTNALSKDVIERYRVTNSLSKDVIERYRVTNAFSKDVAETYRVLNTLSKDVIERYRVTNAWSKDVAESYSVLGGTQFTKDVVERYRVLNFWSKDVAEAYRVTNALSKDVVERYRVLAAWTLDRAESYRVLNGWARDVVERYRVLNTFSKDVIERFTVASGTGFSRDVVERYSVLAAWTRDVFERYAVLSDTPPQPLRPNATAYLTPVTARANLAPVAVTADLDSVS